MVFMILVTVTFWTPAVLNSVGFSLSAAALIVGLNNLGSVIASAMSGWLVHRVGAFRVLISSVTGASRVVMNNYLKDIVEGYIEMKMTIVSGVEYSRQEYLCL